MTASADHPSPAAIRDALREFQQSPGRFAVSRREPRPLFDGVTEVLQLAAGRSTANGEPPSTALRQAARFFVRAAMLRAGATHYEVMGVREDGDLGELREHYRLLIRLTHPDFASDEIQWPEDAAARVNIAHDVLSSSVKRAEYDAGLKPAGGPVPVVVAKQTKQPGASRGAVPHLRNRQRRRAVAAVSWVLVVGVMGVLASVMWTSVEDGSLRQAKPQEPLLNLAESPDLAQLGTGGGWAPDKSFRATVSQDKSRDGGAKPAATAVAASSPHEARPKPPTAVATVPAAQVAVAEASPVLKSEKSLGAAGPEPEEKAIVAMSQREARTPAGQANPVPVVAAEPERAKAERMPSGDIRHYQPVLVDLMHMLETGQSERVLRWAARATRQDAVAERFAGAYQRTIGDATVTGLGTAQFDLRQVADRQVVQGAIQIRMLDRNRQSLVRDFRLKAQFVGNGDGFQMASLEAE